MSASQPSPAHVSPPAGLAVPRRRLATLWSVFLLMLLGVALPVAPALAHTSLASSSPADGAVVVDSVDVLELTFTRSVELLPRTFRIFDASGNEVSRDIEVTRSEDGTVVTGRLDRPLDVGSWEVHWRILASDSHPREGVVRATVAGAPAPSPAPTRPEGAPAGPPTASPDPPAWSRATVAVGPARASAAAPFPSSLQFEVAGDVFRALYYVGLMVAVGLALFKAGPHRGEASNAAGMARAVALGAGVALVAGVLEVVAHAGALAGDGWSGAFDGSTWNAIGRTGLGRALALRVAGLTLLLVGGVRRARRRVPSGPDPTKLLGAGLVLVSFQFVGHTASTAPAWAIRTSDVVHAVAAAVWVGGLVGLALLSGHADRLGRARTAARFSDAAIVAVAAVAVAGVAMAWLNLPTPAALVETDYGRLLLAKLALVGLLGAFGAHNHFRVVPRLTDGDSTALDDLRRTVAAEVVLVVLVLVLTALLVNATPN